MTKRIVPKGTVPSSKKTDLDKILEFYDKGKALPENLEERRLQLEKAWDIARLNPENAVNLIMAQMVVSKPTAYKLLRECQELLGQITKTSKDAQRAMITERLLRLSAKAEEAKDYDTAIKAMGQIAKINRLDQSDDEAADIPQLPGVIYFVPDPSVLFQQVQDVPYETG